MTDINEEEIFGYTIRFDTYSDRWRAKDKEGQEVAVHESRRELLAMLERMNKQVFKRIPVYYGSDEWREADITSMQEDGDFWVSYKDAEGKNRRSKCYGTYYAIYKRNPANAAIVAQLNELKDKRDSISNQMHALSGKLEKFKDDDEIRKLGLGDDDK